MKYMFDLHEMVRVVGGSYKGLEGFIVDIAVDNYNNTIYGIKFSEYDDVLYKLAKDIESIDEVEEDEVIPCPVTLGEYEEIVKEEQHCCGGCCGCDGNCGDTCKCKEEKVEEPKPCGCCHHDADGDREMLEKHDAKFVRKQAIEFLRKLREKLKY